jgi:hypothetical protein
VTGKTEAVLDYWYQANALIEAEDLYSALAGKRG